MAVTYLGTLATNRDRVRFSLQDTVEAAGPKPADGNFTDAEIDGLLTLEGSWQRAVAAGFEVLASAWSRHVSFNAAGMQASQSDIANGYRAEAASWRKRYGSATSTACGSSAVTRSDGYSDDLNNVELES